MNRSLANDMSPTKLGFLSPISTSRWKQSQFCGKKNSRKTEKSKTRILLWGLTKTLCFCLVLSVLYYTRVGGRKTEICSVRIISEYKLCWKENIKWKRSSNPSTGQDRPWGFQEVEAPRFLDNRHMKVIRLPPLGTGCLYPPPPPRQEIFLVLIFLEAESTPGP
jgi:hypothetical protein